MKPFFSIIIPTYNRADLISDAIESVIKQTFLDWELIIIDDGSTDHTLNVIKTFNEPRIKYFFQQNQERSAARNNGIQRAEGDYICFLDSDDCYLSNHLSVLYQAIVQEKNKTTFFYTGRIDEQDDGRKVYRKLYTLKEKHPVLFFWDELLQLNSACIPKNIALNNPFDIRFNSWEDNHFALRILAQIPFCQIPEYTTLLRYHPGKSVVQTFSNVDLKIARRYIDCVNDLFVSYGKLMKPFLSEKDRQDYVDLKWNMFLYQARKNKMFKPAFQIAFKMLGNKFNFVNILTFLKLFGHYALK